MAAVNLLHVIPYYAPAWAYGGVVRAATDLTRALAEAGHTVWVLTTDTLSPAARISVREGIVDGVRVIRVRNASNTLRGRLNLASPLGMGRAARRLIAERGIDVVHCHELRTVENLAVAPVANALGVPLVVSPHGTLPLDTGRPAIKRGWDRLVGRGLMRRFDHVIALTEDEAADARAIWAARGLSLPDDRICVVPNGVHLAEFAALPSGEAFRARWGGRAVPGAAARAQGGASAAARLRRGAGAGAGRAPAGCRAGRGDAGRIAGAGPRARSGWRV